MALNVLLNIRSTCVHVELLIFTHYINSYIEKTWIVCVYLFTHFLILTEALITSLRRFQKFMNSSDVVGLKKIMIKLGTFPCIALIINSLLWECLS